MDRRGNYLDMPLPISILSVDSNQSGETSLISSEPSSISPPRRITPPGPIGYVYLPISVFIMLPSVSMPLTIRCPDVSGGLDHLS